LHYGLSGIYIKKLTAPQNHHILSRNHSTSGHYLNRSWPTSWEHLMMPLLAFSGHVLVHLLSSLLPIDHL